MDIIVSDNKLRRTLETESAQKRAFGTDIAGKLRLRLAALKAAESLVDFWPPKSLPERCHELEGQRKGTFSIDLKHPFRLILRPMKARTKEQTDEQQWWSCITEIEIISIEDTHG
ncbi:MAG TPA: type II toxin-antitoxin system RelE/ParE family toxin [Terracidiphilus sp.]|nr:type II toxin-antitoxin system RelE/ParE family toxin [Terracidiphilus sp.]